MKKKSIILYIGCLLATPLFAQQNNLTADSKVDDVALRDSKAQNKALRDSLAAATSVLAYHPDSIDLRLKKAAWNIQLEQWSYAKDDLDKVLFFNNTNIAGLFYRAFVNESFCAITLPVLIIRTFWFWCLVTSRLSSVWRC